MIFVWEQRINAMPKEKQAHPESVSLNEYFFPKKG
jgi:hypothetical protein